MKRILSDPIVLRLTKLLLAAVAVQVDPQLASDVVLHTRVFLVVQPVQRPAHHRVHLQNVRENTFEYNIVLQQQLL